MSENAHFETTTVDKSASNAAKRLAMRAKNLGQIMQKYPEFQSNSPELYMLAYLREFDTTES